MTLRKGTLPSRDRLRSLRPRFSRIDAFGVKQLKRKTPKIPRVQMPFLSRRALSILRLKPFDVSTSGGRSSERYRRAALTTVASSVARVIALTTSLISVPLTFRYLGAERYGIWIILTSVIAVMGFADLGIGNGLINAISEAYGKDDRRLAREYLTSALVLMLGIAAFFVLAGIVVFPFLPWVRLFNVRSAVTAAEGAKAFLVLFCWFVLNIPLDVVTRAQSGLQRGYSSQIVSALGNIASLLGLLLVIALRGSLAWLVFASTFGVILATLLNGWILFRGHPWLLPSWHAYRTRSAQKILKLGVLFFVLQCANAIGFTSDNIVVAQVLGTASVAIYAVPQRLFTIVAMVFNMALAPLWPAYGEAIARGDVAWVRRVFAGSVAVSLAISIPISTLFVLCGPWILKVAMGKSLHVPLSLLVGLAVWSVIFSVGSAMSSLLNGVGPTRLQVTVAGVASIANLALSIFLTRRLGVIGVCLGSIITQLMFTYPIFFLLVRDLFGKMDQVRLESIEQQNIVAQ